MGRHSASGKGKKARDGGGTRSGSGPAPGPGPRPPLPRRGDTGPIPRISDTGPIPRVAETGPVRRVSDTGPVPRVPRVPGDGRTVSGTGAMPRFGDTGPVPRVSDTGPIPRAGGTGPIPRVSDTGPTPRVGDTGPTPRVAGPGGPPPVHGMPRPSRGPRTVPMDDTGERLPGHPEHREPGGGWGMPPYEQPGRGLGAATVAATPTPVRQDYLDAFDGPGPGQTADPAARRRPGDVPGPSPAADDLGRLPGDEEPPDDTAAALHSTGGGGRRRKQRPANRGRVVTGVAAAVVTCALAAAIAGQVSDGRAKRADAAASDERKQRAGADDDAASRSGDRDDPAGPDEPDGADAGEDARAVPATYTEKMAATYPLSRNLTGSGKLTTVPGHDKAPGRGEVVTYRVDVEDGLPLDGELFAAAVHKTLNDERSWGGRGDRTFERVGRDRESVFVITLASPGTTDEWCAKSGLDTSDEDVSCDSAATERVMINAFRWAQGSKTYGDDIHAYRQMLINHEVGHRLGNGHVGCERDGALAPVMMQQTKYLSTDGATCKPNPWPFPRD
ncbi:DUF3152 domain-containing protein [Streptomyces sp. CNQ-509]|uniref:DUF3152 domain-containing protein n=1 Tax=Streptomyces sp. CNQ-509 TaxID=444103 RepID=UPI000A7DDC8D|nr:DUF3152 domain-containing protein [Streptomyces sp. CNQ-509]